jgi:hypothetical protein
MLAHIASTIGSILILGVSVAALVATVAPNLDRIVDALLGECK